MTHRLRVDYPIVEHTLANGLRVVVSPDASTPVVAVNLWYDVGSRDEPAGRTGWAHLFEHLMFQGSASVASGEHLQAMQDVGGSVNATTWFDRTNYFETIPPGALDLALWLEADRLATLPDFLTSANLDTQRDVVKEEKRQRYDNVPYGDAMQRLVQLAFPPSHPYGHTTIGSMADLDQATPEAAAAFFRAHYRPDNAVLTIAGDVSVADAISRAEQYFGDLTGLPGEARVVPEPLPPLSGVPRAEVTADVPQDAVNIVWRLPVVDTPAFDAADLALDILGAGQASRLYRDLLRDRGLVTDVGTSALGLVGGNSLGMVSAAVTPGADPSEVETLIVGHIEALAAEGPTEDELRRAFAQYERDWLTNLAAFDSRADTLSAYAILHGDPALVNTRLDAVASITADDVRDACRNFLAPAARAVLTYHADAGSADEPEATSDPDVSESPEPTASPDQTPVPARAPGSNPRPDVRPPSQWTFPVPVSRTLDNGLNVLVFQRGGQHITCAELVLDLPLEAERRDVEGVGTITQRCLAEGTLPHPGSEFALTVEGLGAAIDGFAAHSATHLLLDVPAPGLAAGLSLLAEAILQPELSPDDIERQCAIRLAEIDQALANSAYRAALAFREASIADRFRAARPAGGGTTSVAALSAADVRTFHHGQYRPDGATLVLAGDFVDDPLPAVEAAFGAWAPGSGPQASHESPQASEPRFLLIDRPGAVQADLRLGTFGLDRRDPAYADLTVACHALGGSFLSRLNRELREERGFTYGVHLTNQPMRSGGLASVEGSFRTEVLVEALDRARDILDVAAQPLTDHEVATAVSYATGIAPLQYATASDLAGGVGALAAAGLGYDYVDAHALALSRVTPESATAAISKVLRPDGLTLVVVGDATTLADPLTAAGWPVTVID